MAPAEAAETLEPTAGVPQPAATGPEAPVEVPGLQGWGAPAPEPAAAAPEPEAPVEVPGLAGWGKPTADPTPADEPVEEFDPGSDEEDHLDPWAQPAGGQPTPASPFAQAQGDPFAAVRSAPVAGDPFAPPSAPGGPNPWAGSSQQASAADSEPYNENRFEPGAPAQPGFDDPWAAPSAGAPPQGGNPYADLDPQVLESVDPFAADPLAQAQPPGASGGAPAPARAADSGYGFMDLVGMGGAPGQRAIVDVNSRALAVLVHRDGQPRARVMIPANTPLPVTATNVFNTVYDNQRGVRVVVLEGDSDDPDDCVRLGECLIMDLPQRPKGHPIEIHYCYDVSGRVSVHARDQATGAAATIQFQR